MIKYDAATTAAIKVTAAWNALDEARDNSNGTSAALDAVCEEWAAVEYSGDEARIDAVSARIGAAERRHDAACAQHAAALQAAEAAHALWNQWATVPAFSAAMNRIAVAAACAEDD